MSGDDLPNITCLRCGHQFPHHRIGSNHAWLQGSLVCTVSIPFGKTRSGAMAKRAGEYTRMKDVLARLYTWRRKRREATAAMRSYLAEQWGEYDPGDDITPGDNNPNRHKFGECREILPPDGEPGPVCQVCAGSEPFHKDYLEASRQAGNALRQAQRMGRAISEGRQ